MSSTTRNLAAVLATLALAACPKSSDKKTTSLLHVPSPAWEDQVVYFVLTDRFADGDPTNDDQGAGEFDPTKADSYSGGDLQGVIDHLDYIQGLGATAVWITPPVANQWWDPSYGIAGYHGYWARDLSKVDEHVGTLEKYKALSEALHARGMYLIQDVVPNHMGNFFTYGSSYDPACLADWTAPACDPTVGYASTGALPSAKPTQTPFDQDDPRIAADRAAAIYHWTPQITNYLDPYQEKFWQISDLDDLNTENPVVRKALKESYGYWVKEVGVDGFRVDTAKFVPIDFWKDFFNSTDPAEPGILEVARSTGRTDFLAFGEVFEVSGAMSDEGEQKIAPYLGTPAAPVLPSALQFPLYKEIGNLFAGGRPTAEMGYRLGRFMDPTLFPDPYRIPTFIDNHDVKRFLAQGTERAEAQALTFLFTLPGIPVVYQGTEQYYRETRQAMFKGGWAPGAPLGADQFDTLGSGYQRVKALAALRKAQKALRRGDLTVLYSNVASGALGYARSFEGETVLVLLNTADKPTLVAELATGLPAGTVLESLYAENMGATPVPKVAQGGKMLTTLPARAILVARVTSTVVTPPTPAATIAVTTPVAGQIFTADTALSGTVTPAPTQLQLVVDDDVSSAIPIAVAGDGSWNVILPVSTFPDGLASHVLTVHAPVAGVSGPRLAFQTNVVFSGDTLVVADPEGDDTGPSGRAYTYPTDASYHREMDLTEVKAEVGATQMRLNLKLKDHSTFWNPDNGFDHVCFDIFFQVPGQAGATVLPRMQASAPAGFGWSLQHFAFGWGNAMYTSAGATASQFGAPVPAPTIRVDQATGVITFSYNRNAYGLADWTGVKVYVATWDFDGIQGRLQPVLPEAAPYRMGGGVTDCFEPDGVTPKDTGCADPLIMDEVAPFTLP